MNRVTALPGSMLIASAILLNIVMISLITMFCLLIIDRQMLYERGVQENQMSITIGLAQYAGQVLIANIEKLTASRGEITLQIVDLPMPELVGKITIVKNNSEFHIQATLQKNAVDIQRIACMAQISTDINKQNKLNLKKWKFL